MDTIPRMDNSAFSFGTPNRNTSDRGAFVSPTSGLSTSLGRSPDEFGRTTIATIPEKKRSASIKKTIYQSFPKKSANERLIDIKNATYRNKHIVHHQGRADMKNKILYNVGPREAYIVDKAFDGDLNFTDPSGVEEDAELIIKRRPEKEYVVEVDTGYNNEHSNSKSKVTPGMRNQLFKDMFDHHHDIQNNPDKYNRAVV